MPQHNIKNDDVIQTFPAEGTDHTFHICALPGRAWGGQHLLDSHSFHLLDKLVAESGHAFSTGTQTADVEREQAKLMQADAVIFQFPLWWFGFPAIMKGWVDRVFAYGFAYGYKGAGNRYRYGEGALAGKRALLSVTVGGPLADYGERGINGPLEQLLFPITHGTLFFAGMDVLPTCAVYNSGRLEANEIEAQKSLLEQRVARLFTDAPIPFRRQNGGDYPDGHTLGASVAPNLSGIAAHIRP